jgi:PKD repeat protein
MKPLFFNHLGRLLILCLAATALFTACEPEDDDFFDFRPVDFFIDADKMVIDAGQSIAYDDKSNNATSREWSFEGGIPATSTDAQPSITYPEAGTFLTFVTTTFADGSTQRRRLQVLVNPPVFANFTANPTALQRGNAVQFSNTTQGVGAIPAVLGAGDTAIIHAWFVPGVTVDTIFASNPSIVFPETGLYDVSLTVTRRSTGFVSTETKTEFIQTFDDPVTQSRSARFGRDGSAIFLALNESTGALAGDLTSRLTVTEVGGGTVAITSAEKPAWGDNIVQLNVDASTLTPGANYTISFTETGTFTVGSGSVVLPFEYDLTFLGQSQTWAELNFSTGGGNDPITTALGGKEFTFDQDGVTFTAGANTNIFIFNQGAAALTQTYHNNASTYTMLITPGMDAALSDIGDVGLELGWLGPNGTNYTFSQPITDLRFVNGFGNPDFIPEGTLSADGKTLTITKQGNRNQAVRISATLEGGISETGFMISHNSPEGGTVYVTASGR